MPTLKSPWLWLTGVVIGFGILLAQEPGLIPGMGRPPGPPAERKIVKDFDRDGDGKLSSTERSAARQSAKEHAAQRGPNRGVPPNGPGPGGPPGMRNREPGKPGKRVSLDDVTPLDAPLYDPTVVRTLFLEFEQDDWEAELSDFIHTDVEVPATLIVDGKRYPGVGVHFRGASSLMGAGMGNKRSLNISVDETDKKQRLYGYKTLNLLNCNQDPSFMHTVLYLRAARQYMPAPKANFVRLVINGESWGLYANAQQFDKVFLAENYKQKGTRWKVPGSPQARGGLEYLGENIADYQRHFEMKSNDDDKAWKALIDLCKTLNQTPTNQLESALESKLDLEGVLKFLALEMTLINNDGYCVRASDYCLFLDETGTFHVIPHDANETFQPGMMGPPPGRGGPGGPPPFGPHGFGPPGFGPPPGNPGDPNLQGQGRPAPPDGQPNAGNPPRGSNNPPTNPNQPGRPNPQGPNQPGPGGRPPMMTGGGVELDPLMGLTDETKPLRSKLLAVPALRKRYLEYVKTMSEDWLNWKNLQPVVKQYSLLIEKEVSADTRKLTSYADFQQAISEKNVSTNKNEPSRGPGPMTMNLKQFANERYHYLMNHKEIKSLK